MLDRFGSDFMGLLEGVGGQKEIIFALTRDRGYEKAAIARFSYSLRVQITGYRRDEEFCTSIASTHERKRSEGDLILEFDDHESTRSLRTIESLLGFDNLLSHFTSEDSDSTWRPSHQDALYILSGIIIPWAQVLESSASLMTDVESAFKSFGSIEYNTIRDGLRMVAKSGRLPVFEGYKALTTDV